MLIYKDNIFDLIDLFALNLKKKTWLLNKKPFSRGWLGMALTLPLGLVSKGL